MRRGAAGCCIALAAMVIGTSAEAHAEPPCYAKGWDVCVDRLERLAKFDEARKKRGHPLVLEGLRNTWQDKCVDDEDAGSCVLVALAQTEGYGGPEDLEAARGALWLACKFDPNACDPLADALKSGDGVPYDVEFAAQLIAVHESEQEADDSAEEWDSDYYDRIGYAVECDRGRVDSCIAAAVMIDQGKGGARDADRAYRLFWVACDLDRSTCIDIAHAYKRGKKVKRNKKHARKFRKLAMRREGEKGCRYGSTDRCVTNGHAFMKGKHVSRDREYAVVLFQEACNSGNADGCTGLADSYWSGPKRKRDRKKAANLYEQACKDKSAAACWKLGRLLLRGEKREQDLGRAEELFKRACDLGDQAGCDYMEKKP